MALFFYLTFISVIPVCQEQKVQINGAPDACPVNCSLKEVPFPGEGGKEEEVFLQPNIKAICVVMGSVGPH